MICMALLCCAHPQWPEDARALAAWHSERVAGDALSAPREDDWRERLFVYQWAGAETEAWAAAAALAKLAPGDPDGERYQVQLATGNPARWEEGLGLADAWLARQVGQGSRPEAEVQGVRAARSWLAERVGERQNARRHQEARFWLPILILLLLGALATLAVRRAR